MPQNRTINVIGNGYDLSLKLKTSYKDFKEYLSQEEKGKEVINLIDEFLSLCDIKPEDIKNWSDFEYYLSLINDIDDKNHNIYYKLSLHNENQAEEKSKETEILTNKAKGYINNLIDSIKYVKSSFKGWIKTINKRIEDDPYFNSNVDFYENEYFLTFNYTNTLEIFKKIPTSNILYIHGNADSKDLILGHNKYFSEPFNYDNIKHSAVPIEFVEVNSNRDPHFNFDGDNIDSKIIDEINSGYSELHKLLFKNSDDLIKENESFFKRFNDADRVVFIGLSLGSEDIPYLKEIFNRIKEGTELCFYYYSKEDYDKVKLIETITNGKYKTFFKRYDVGLPLDIKTW